MKKLVSLLLIAAFVLAIAGCGKNEESAELGKISMWTWLGSEEVWGGKTKDIMAMQDFAKTMKVDLDIINPSGDAGEAFNLMMTKGDKLPDMVFYSWSPKRVMDYSKKQRIVNIAPYIEKYMPNFNKLLQSNPRLKAQMYTEDGGVYYLPWISMDKIFYEGMMMRGDWLAAVNMPAPTTVDQLHATLLAMKKQADAGKLPGTGGSKFLGFSGFPLQFYKWLYGFGTCHEFQLADDGKTVEYGPTTDNYRKAMVYFNTMYKEGLIDPDIFANDGDTYKKHHLANQTACFVDNLGTFEQIQKDAAGLNNKIDYVAVPYPLYNGEAVPREYNSTAKRIAQPYGFALTVKNEQRLIKILQVMDWKYSAEGQTLFNWGVEGKTFSKDANGAKVYSDLIMKDPKYAPGIAQSKYVKVDFTVEDTQTVWALVNDFGKNVYKVWANTNSKYAYEPTLWYTADEMAIMGKTQTDINTYRDEMRDKFVAGKLDPRDDAVWKNYLETLTKMGQGDWLKVEQAAYDRFTARLK
ncbi:MAG: hypothetical protein WCP79_02870 [Bacillota bacterium]